MLVVAGRTDRDAVLNMLGGLRIRNVAAGGAVLVAVLEYKKGTLGVQDVPGISGYRSPNNPSYCR